MEPLERAITELREKNYGSAIRLLETLTARDPANAEAHRQLSRAYYETGEREKAAEAAQRFVALRPTDASGHHNLGVLLAQLGQTAAAERAFRAALSADPGHAKARRALHKLAGEADAADAGAAETPQAGTAVAGTDDPKRRGVPWQAKLAAALTVVASIAILLWLFLPGGPANPGSPTQAPRPAPNPVTVPPADQPTAPDRGAEGRQQPSPAPASTGQPQVRPQLEPDTQALDKQSQPSGPLPSPEQPSQVVPQTRNLWRRVWRTPRVYWRQPQWYAVQPHTQVPQMGTGTPQQQGSVPTSEASGQGPAGQTQTPAPTPTSPQARAQPQAQQAPPIRQPRAQMTGQPQQQPKPQPEPQPPPQPEPQSLFTPDEARQVAEAMDAAEREGIQAELHYLAEWLRSDPACNDREFWPILQTALATTGPTMAPQGLSIGAGEVMALITNAPTNWDAADSIEYHSRNLRSVLPHPVKAAIAQVLASSTSAQNAWNRVDNMLRRNSTQVSQQTANVLLEALLRAERIASQRQAAKR